MMKSLQIKKMEDWVDSSTFDMYITSLRYIEQVYILQLGTKREIPNVKRKQDVA